MKQHLTVVSGQVASCKKVLNDVRHRMVESLKGGIKRKVDDRKEQEQVDIRDLETNDPIAPTLIKMVPESGANKRQASSVSVENYFTPRTTPDCLSFQKAIDAIALIGPRFKAPNAYEFRVNLLTDWKKEYQLLIESHRAKWKNTGCTLMADGRIDVRQQTLINFLVYSTHGMVFVKSVNASDLVGPKNIVHVVIDNVANYVACGKLIKKKYQNIYWSPCTAHRLNLTLKDIASLDNVSALATKALKITVFVYNHMIFLSWLRKRPSWKEIVHPGAIRFATTFITLYSIYMHKHDLQALVIDKHFVDHKLSKTQVGIIVTAIILDNGFWDDCLEIVKVVSPLIKLLRIVDSNEKPSLPYVYEAAYLLNPAFLYDENFVHKRRLMDAMLDVIESNESEEIDYIVMMKQLNEWWSFYGGSVPELQTLAMHILSQTSSSSGCERNWKEEELALEFNSQEVANLEIAIHNETIAALLTLESDYEDDEYMNVLESLSLPDVTSGFSFSHSTPNVSMLGDLNEVNDDFGFLGCNAFSFELNLMSITLWDVFMYLGLPITREENFYIIFEKYGSYTTLSVELERKIRSVSSYMKKMELFFEKLVDEPITLTEHLVSIWILLSQ
ncbi:uncharacterized protein LOC129322534 [Prosopis cineraria]|uniref:uncharacterized protein LOC129322534 n=1 Tax=Prosopis cineraria TaxID=364024 RepID=UPI00240F2780|nr:uncharacterized protein LOC129322534 [Prosopis cineraria]